MSGHNSKNTHRVLVHSMPKKTTSVIKNTTLAQSFIHKLNQAVASNPGKIYNKTLQRKKMHRQSKNVFTNKVNTMSTK